MKKKVIVLGAGRVGGAMAIDLSKSYEVTAVDRSDENLSVFTARTGIKTIQQDLSEIRDWYGFLVGFDLVLSAVPGFMGYEIIKHIIDTSKNVVDISFFSEDPFELDSLAKEKGVTAVVDCGVAPGMGNIILGHYHAVMEVKKYVCYVGGLPVKRKWPWEYKAVFSPIDVIEEYIRPARYIQNGEIVVREALSDPELLEFDEVGSLEAWNSDGLRTLIKTIDAPDMIEKTLRYPGTIEYLRVLRESGFFSYEEVEVSGHRIRPIDLTAKLLFPMWKMKKGERDFTIMRIEIEGIKEGKDVKIVYDLYDEYDAQSGTISMARTTGYTATAVVDMILKGQFEKPGICPPEYIGEEEGKLELVLDYLKDRGVLYKKSIFPSPAISTVT